MQTNTELNLAWKFIEETGRNVFLTGKAGTGKTTFLKELRKTSHKRIIVVAPTGVAAINAGGVTIHSFFQLSFAPYVPDVPQQRRGMKKTVYRFGKEKINIIRSVDLLVIDEISMVRADLLDNMDSVLRRYRDREKPFGGVQLLMIGDMQQLAPVVKEDEKELLADYYETFFFFSSRALKETSYVTIELKQVFRQSESGFLELLNKVRINRMDDEALAILNRRYIPAFTPGQEKGYITLTTHNWQAKQLNDRKLKELPGTSYSYQAKIEKDFPENLYPVEPVLILKKDVQVMFVKNDTETPRRFYNGKIGRVTSISPTRIEVLCEDTEIPLVVERVKWDNTQYSLNDNTKEIEEKIVGTFEHYPLKTAWAITIHKSQGLTFEHAIINANASFAHGQVYVALSRCKTLEGMVLSAPLTYRSLVADEVIARFSEGVENSRHDEEEVRKESEAYFYALVCELFDFSQIDKLLHRVVRLLDEFFYRLYPKLLQKYKEYIPLFSKDVLHVGQKFHIQYTQIIEQARHSEIVQDEQLQQRIVAGATYFKEKMEVMAALLLATEISSDNKELKKKFTDAFDELNAALSMKLSLLGYASGGFTLHGYLNARALAMIPEETVSISSRRSERSAKKKMEVPEDILHPRLFSILRGWRDQKARELNLPVYTVIQQKAIQGITNLLPVNKEELVHIPYFGKKGMEKYGDEILGLVCSYMKEEGISREDGIFNTLFAGQGVE